MKDPAGPFRTKVRVKDAGREPDGATAAVEPQATPRRPGSLLEALKRARRPQPTAHPQDAETADGAGPPWDSRHDRETAEPQTPTRPKPPRPARAKVGRLAAAKLRQLQRAREAAASLEGLARGEIEEAVVEIIPRNGTRKDRRRPAHPAPKR